MSPWTLLPVAAEQLGARWAASDMPVIVVKHDVNFAGKPAPGTEVYCPFLS
jgi:hypothetical protein